MATKTALIVTEHDAREAVAAAERHLVDVERRVGANDMRAVAELRPAREAVDDARLVLEQAGRVEQLQAAQANREAAREVLDWLEGPPLADLADRYLTAYQASVTAQVEAAQAWHQLYTEYQAHLRQLRQLAKAGPLPDGVEHIDSGYADFTIATPAGSWLASGLKYTEQPDEVALDEARAVVRGRPPRLSMTPRVRRWMARGRGDTPAPLTTPHPSNTHLPHATR